MSRKIVSISYINGSAEFMEVERSQSGSFTLSPSFANTSESLQAACERADEIYINSLFPSAQFDWETFPKVEDRYLHSLITSTVQRKRPSTKLSARYQYIRDVVKDGNAGSLVAFQSVEKNDIDAVFTLLQKCRKKVKYIYNLPSGLAGTVLQSEKPAGNTLLLWCRESFSMLIIFSPDGLVKIARTLPYGLPGGEGPDAEQSAAADFSGDISREVMMTVNYFKQKFREPAPENIYLLGDEKLQDIFSRHPIKNLDASLQFTLAGDLPEGIEPAKYNENIHLWGNLFANEAFNFLPVQETRDRKSNSMLTVALVVVAVLIGLAALWSLRISAPPSTGDLTGQIQELQFEIKEVQASIAELKPIEGRKKYYQSAFLDDNPRFIGILQQIAGVMPDTMRFEDFSMNPGEGMWNCMITGRIRGKDWQERLDTLREFGRALYSFENFDIQSVAHSLGQAGMDDTSISFQLALQFKPGEEKK